MKTRLLLPRHELQRLLVTDADAFTALRYLRHRESVPALPEIEDNGREAMPGIEGMLADLYYALWDPEPRVRDEVPPDRRYWRELLGQTLKTSAYEELHAATQLKELESVLGTIAMGESIIAIVPKEDRQKLQEIAEKQQQANELGEQTANAQAEADATRQLADAAAQAATHARLPLPDGASQEATADRQGQAASGQPASGAGQLTPKQAKALANELAKQAAEAQAKAEQLQKQANEAGVKAEQLSQDLLGKPSSLEAQKKLDELRRVGLAAAKAAQAKVEDISETIEAWGLEPAELIRHGISEAMELLERMKRSEALRKFAALLGRIRKIAARKAKNKMQGEGARTAVPETGRNIRRAHRSELVALVHPALRFKALQRWTRDELRLHGQRARTKLGHGPVIVCEDASGSMEGAKQQWAKAVTLSLAHYAKLQRRTFGWIMFDARVQRAKTYLQGRLSPEELFELAESRAGGGTDFQRPLARALVMIQKEGLKKADICLITDGECAVSDDFLREFGAAKKALEFNVVTILCDVGSSADSAVREFSDRIEKASAFSAEEAEANVLSQL